MFNFVTKAMKTVSSSFKLRLNKWEMRFTSSDFVNVKEIINI